MLGRYGKDRVRAGLIAAVAADAAVQIRTLLYIRWPRIGVHAEPLRGHVVEDEETRAGTGEQCEEADELLSRDAASNVVESSLDQRASVLVGEVTQAAQRRLNAAPHQTLVNRPLVVMAGVDRHGPDCPGVGVKADRQQQAPFHEEVEEDVEAVRDEDQT